MSITPMRRFALLAAALVLTSGCSLEKLVEVTPTSDVVDPSVVRNATGSIQLYTLAVSQFASGLGGNPAPGFPPGSPSGRNFVLHTARWTDELMWVGNAYDQSFGL